MTIAPGRPLLLRAQGLRRGQPGHPRVQGRDQGRLQPARKVVLMTALGAVAAAAVVRPDAVRRCRAGDAAVAASCTTSAWLWLALGVGGLVFRTVHLFFLQDVQTGLVVVDEDPHRPVPRHQAVPQGAAALLRGELIDPMNARAASAERQTVRDSAARSISRRTLRRIDLLVSAGVRPPPAVGLHRARGGHEALARPPRSPRRCSSG